MWLLNPDPGSGAFLTLGSGMVKESSSGSGMYIPDHISESLETSFWIKNILILRCRSGSEIRNLFGPCSGIRDGKIRIRDPG
jgi:hypothetical protein